MSELRRFAKAAWDLFDKGTLPESPALSTGDDIDAPCVNCKGLGTIDAGDGTRIPCRGPKHAPRKELPR